MTAVWTARPVAAQRRLTAFFTLLVALLMTATLVPASVAGAAGAAGDDLVPDRILVNFRADAPAAAKADARRSAGAEHLSTIDALGVHVWHVPEHAAPSALARLQRNPHVAYAELVMTWPPPRARR